MSDFTTLAASGLANLDVSIPPTFVDRRQSAPASAASERRQFGNTYRDLSLPGRELAEAIDAHKVRNRRRYITTDEMLEIIYALGYRRDNEKS